ncbi:galactokinase [Olivibacter domesticus]|uniref:Galactokinase n=1 Tax=Olivibacter domesticus TaxID=407022 RepID=A0A1H7S276_OLID1|nr:galactokinase [Olivibacter domesticus]SEL66575.1 galactokinase [Olivibacter domesticus]
MTKAVNLKQSFFDIFQHEPLIVRSPGRVNLIGEHTDYNNGLVLPAAINKNVFVAIAKNKSNRIRLHSLDLNDSYETSLDNIKKTEKLWPDYILGVIEQLQLNNYAITEGFDIAFTGDIPQGAGLSSSAALECATAFALSELFNLNIPKLDIALFSQAAENQFVGVNCGLMDQFASVFGKEQHLIKLDCADYSYEYIPFNTTDIKILLLDTQVKHSLASSAYNERRQQCEEGVRLISAHHPEVKSLREATESQLLTYVKPVSQVIYNRCSYIVSEIDRLKQACEDLKKDDFSSFGKRMFETHEGLQHLYEVSCKELDLLVELVKDNPDVLGARMMGGGFGGCTINLVKADKVEDIAKEIVSLYKKKTGVDIPFYIAEINKGTSIANQGEN